MLVNEAIRHLRKALGREKQNASAYRQLAQAYARKRKISKCRTGFRPGLFL